VEQQDVHRVHFKMPQRMVHQDVECHVQVGGGGDGRVDVAQGGQFADLFLALVEQVGAMDGVSGDASQRAQQVDVILHAAA
jgi:hypothetical protein